MLLLSLFACWLTILTDVTGKVKNISRFSNVSYPGLRPLLMEADSLAKQLNPSWGVEPFFVNTDMNSSFEFNSGFSFDEGYFAKIKIVDECGKKINSLQTVVVAEAFKNQASKVCWFSGSAADYYDDLGGNPASYNTNMLNRYIVDNDVFFPKNGFSFTDNSVGSGKGMLFSDVEEVEFFCSRFLSENRVSHERFCSFLTRSGLSAFVSVVDGNCYPSAMLNESFSVHTLFNYPDSPRLSQHVERFRNLFYGSHPSAPDVMPSLGCFIVQDDVQRWVWNVAESYFGDAMNISDDYDADGLVDYRAALKSLSELYVSVFDFLRESYGPVSAFHIAAVLSLSTRQYPSKSKEEVADAMRSWFAVNSSWNGNFNMLRLCLTHELSNDTIASVAVNPVHEWLKLIV